MKKIIDDDRLIYKCCHLYYKDELGQQEICDRLGISRTTVSRLLKLGREKGIVKIRVENLYERLYDDLERKLEEKYHLKEVVIVDESEFETVGEHQRRFNEESLRYLSRIIHGNDYVGVSMGKTLFNIANESDSVDEINCTFVPVVGGVGYGQINEGYHSNDIAYAFAKKFNGQSLSFFAPAMFHDEMTMKGFLKEKSVKKVTDLFEKLKTVLMGIGATNENGTLVQSGYIDEDDLSSFIERGAVGDCLLKMVDQDGMISKFKDFNDRVMGLSDDQLLKIPNRVGFALGKEKAGAVLGVLRSKRVNILVTDIACVKKLLEIQ